VGKINGYEKRMKATKLGVLSASWCLKSIRAQENVETANISKNERMYF